MCASTRSSASVRVVHAVYLSWTDSGLTAAYCWAAAPLASLDSTIRLLDNRPHLRSVEDSWETPKG